MTEVGRLLRYAVPGAIFKIVVGAWLAIDPYPYLEVTELSEGQAVGASALLVAAAFPVGYLISVLANEVAWFARRCSPHGRVLGRIRTDRVIAIALGNRRHRRLVTTVWEDLDLDPNSRDRRCRADEAIAEIFYRTAKSDENHRAAIKRVRSLADQMNGLINSCVALALGGVVSLGLFVCTCALGDETVEASRWILMILLLLVWIVGLWLVLRAESRVAYITEVFVIGIVRRDSEDDD